MKIGLIDVDGHNFPNVPLMKISAYHKAIGDSVEWWFPLNHYDRVYKSKVFSFTPDIVSPIQADEVIEGGTGYAITLENGREIYRKEKEGLCSRQVADISDFYRGQKEILLLDPNILANENREKLLAELAGTRANIDFSQGLDIRLTDGVESLIKNIRTKRIHFAWDNAKQDLRGEFETFKKRTNYGYSKLMVYVLVNFNSTMEENLYRVYTLRDLGYDPYIMIYDKEHSPKEIRKLQRWVNNKIIFRSIKTFEEYKEARI